MYHPDDPTGAAIIWPFAMIIVYASMAFGWVVLR